ncbi:transposase [Nocardiopsis alba]|uniref:transposase n=1 Tax=Nocardiopsis alba TaxID=53437 RepID=UPI00364DACD2
MEALKPGKDDRHARTEKVPRSTVRTCYPHGSGSPTEYRDPPRAISRVSDQLDIKGKTLHNWVNQAEVDAGHRPGTTTDQPQQLAELERQNRELKRANAILKFASAFFAAELDRPHTR